MCMRYASVSAVQRKSDGWPTTAASGLGDRLYMDIIGYYCVATWQYETKDLSTGMMEYIQNIQMFRVQILHAESSNMLQSYETAKMVHL